jgi:hypothetical protein
MGKASRNSAGQPEGKEQVVALVVVTTKKLDL